MESAVKTTNDSFITKLLGEMKNQFMGDSTEIMTEKEKQNESAEPSSQIESTKPKNKSKTKDKGTNTIKKSPVVKKTKIETKRSSLRRNKSLRSVLQNAIARKEKSFNVVTKSLRSTRQLKPTTKILENLSAAKLERKLSIETQKSKVRKRSTESKSAKKKKTDEENDLSNELCLSHSSNDLCSPKEISSHIEDKPKNEIISVAEELIASRKCLCTETSNFIIENNNGKVFCSAVDSIDEKLIGCNRLAVTNRPLMRPSKRVPYSALCELHENRMLRHNCCPTCGIFCTQGKFAECNSSHQYHRNCQLTIADFVCCPHCGCTKLGYDIFITLHSKRKPIYLKKQQIFD